MDNLPSLTQEEVDEIFNTAAVKNDPQHELSQTSHPFIQLEQDVLINPQSDTIVEDQQFLGALSSQYQSSSSVFEENITSSITGQKRPFAAIQRAVLDEPETDSKKQRLIMSTELQPVSSDRSPFQISLKDDSAIPSIFSNEEPENL